MKYLVLICITIFTLAAQPYKNALINIHAKVFPKILLTDTKLKNKLVDNAIKIIILYSKQDIKTAQKLKSKMLSFYPKIKNHTLNILLQEYNAFEAEELATAYYQLLGDKKDIILTNMSAKNKSIITFSYDNSYLNHGTIMSVHIGKKVSPYINIKALKSSEIILNNIIYKIAKVK